MNMPLFVKSIIESDFNRLYLLSIILLVFYMAVLAAILIDLWSGVERARRNGNARTSYGFRRTIIKIKEYFGLLMLFTITDVVASVWLSLPFFTALGAIGMIWVEAKSVHENKKDIKGLKDLPQVIIDLLKNKDNISKVVNFLENEQRTKK